MSEPVFSVVVPVHDEEDNLRELQHPPELIPTFVER